MRRLTTALAACLAFAAGPALAQITIGVSVSATGPGASLGVPIRNTFALLPQTIGGEQVKYVILDDGSDPTGGAKIARKFATEDKVDVIIGSSAVPVATAQAAIAMETRIPFIALCPIGIDPAKVFVNVQRYGNMSAGTIPVALAEALDEGRIRPGATLLMPSFGAGLAWCAHLVRWGQRVAPRGASDAELPPCERTGLELVRELRARRAALRDAARAPIEKAMPLLRGAR